MTTPQTLPQYWLQQVLKYRGTNKVATRQKERGIWQRFVWDEEYRQVQNFALGLESLGLQPGQRVVIIGDNDRENLWGALAIMAMGGIMTGVFTDATPAEIAYAITYPEATFVLAGDQEQVDKLLEIKERVGAHVQKVIYWDERGMWHYDDPWLMNFREVQALGQNIAEAEPKRFDASIARGKKNDVAMFCFTSGTTGMPKAAMITHGNFIYESFALAEIDPRTPDDNYLSFIPMAWIGGAALDLGPHTTHGVILNFAERPETVQADIREIAPDSLLYNSRLWETLVSAIQVRIQDASWLNRKLYNLFMPVGERMADLQLARKNPPWLLRILYALGKIAVFKPLLSQYGLHRARSAYTSGAALSPDVLRFFMAMGLPIRQIYGATELTGGAVAHRRDDIKFSSVGVPLPGSDMMISEAGEIYLTGPGLFEGYYKKSADTEAALYVDNRGVKWFKTGDAGYIDEDGHLIYLDRMKDMIRLGTGDRYSPQYIEGRLKFSPYISHAMTIGDESKGYVTAIITIDFDNVGRWAEVQGVSYTTYADLSQRPEVYELILQDVKRVNSILPESARVRKFVLLHKEFDADEGEMTRTRKLRRSFLAERYAAIVDALYSDVEFVHIHAPVTYQDGREAIIDARLKIQRVYSK